MDQSDFLRGHPIFTPKDNLDASLGLSSLSELKRPSNYGSSGKERIGRRSIMALREYDLLLAVDNEIRITSLIDARTAKPQERSYKILYAPNIEFEIHQIVVNPNGKLLAVAGVRQVAVISLPRSYSKLVSSRVDCRTIQIGQFYHATNSATPVAKIEWHPWGKNACSLLVMTVDGMLREYDISVDPEEPQQVISFMPEHAQTSSVRGDSSSREIVSFCLGKGKADWGPLTVYALTKSGDIWAMCPFLPSNATVPAAYIYALEYFVRAKQEGAVQSSSAANLDPAASFSSIYAYQLKYVMSLIKQISEVSTILLSARTVNVQAPSIVKAKPMRQGPFLLQPSPIELEGEGGDATDLIYLEQAGSSPLYLDDNGHDERLGVLAISYSDGKIDITLDLEKVEALWETNQHSLKKISDSELPMLVVYETIDLGLVSAVTTASVSSQPTLSFERYREKDILRLNRPVFVADPIYQDMLYLYHACGLHSLNLSPWLQPLANSMQQGIEKGVGNLVAKGIATEVTSMISTFSAKTRSSKPVYGLALPGDVYLSYSLYAISNSFEIHVRDLVLRVKEDATQTKTQQSIDLSSLPASILETLPELEAKEESLVGYLSRDPFKTPALLTTEGIEDLRRLKSHVPKGSADFQITPDLLRQFASTVQEVQSRIRGTLLAATQLQNRMMMQDMEFLRQQNVFVELMERTKQLKGDKQQKLEKRFEAAITQQQRLLARSDRVLQQLMDSTSLTLNEHEMRWFAELKRMKTDVFGESAYDAGSLKARTETLSNRLESYLPSLRELSKREQQRKDESQQHLVLGRAQEHRMLMRLGEHKKAISDTLKRVEDLAKRMDMELEGIPDLG